MRRGAMRAGAGLLLSTVAAVPVTAQSVTTGANRATVADGFTVLVAGDLLGPDRPVTTVGDPAVNAVVALIRRADVAVANLESSAFDLDAFDGARSAQNGGGVPRFDSDVIRDFKALGLDMVSLANNHAGDWGSEGLRATLTTVREAGLVPAGAGSSLAQARAPGIFAARGGRVALIATASTFNPATPAGDGSPAIRPRPGISVLRTGSAIVVNEAQMTVLRSIAAPDADGRHLMVGEQAFVVGKTPGRTYTVDAADETAILSSVTAARAQADVTLLAIHAHETPGGTAGEADPADFLPDFFHKAIDAGADIIMRTGPHVLAGIEIRESRPIFYGLGSLFWGLGGPARNFRGTPVRQIYYDTAVATAKFLGSRVVEVRIYPLVIRTDDPKTFSAPTPAPPDAARRILEKLQNDSRRYGTVIQIERGVGVIRIAP